MLQPRQSLVSFLKSMTTRAVVGMGIPMGMGMGWVWG